MRYLTFSRQYPATHPRKGQPTYFVEKIYQSLYSVNGHVPTDIPPALGIDHFVPGEFDLKGHTIRAGKRWKAGDMFSPRVWSGKPYYSKQIIIAPAIKIVQTWDIEIDFPNRWINIAGAKSSQHFNAPLELLAKNDGLSLPDFKAWFGEKRMDGQIICWDDRIGY